MSKFESPSSGISSSDNAERTIKSRTEKPTGYPDRFLVTDEMADWSVEYTAYDPPYYVSPSVVANDCTANPTGWADPEDISRVDRVLVSYEGPVLYNPSGLPQNPLGRTGIIGRGLLGKYGANFAADPIVTRINPVSNQLEMVAIVRGDTGQTAIPGGMVDAGESVSATLGREFKEETGAELDMSTAVEIYQGYVDDPRNTDNAWMETTAMHRHLSSLEAEQVQFRPPDDPDEIRGVQWSVVNHEFLDNLYASHQGLVIAALEKMVADSKLSHDQFRDITSCT
jgi:ADP-ribose pyrophosphatase